MVAKENIFSMILAMNRSEKEVFNRMIRILLEVFMGVGGRKYRNIFKYHIIITNH